MAPTDDAEAALRWDDLRAFLAVARGGTLAVAADTVGVNASTVHRRVAALESALGARLFERDRRGYALTEVGEALVPRAAEVEEAVHAVRRAATGHDRRASGSVSLTLPSTLLPVVAPFLTELRASCPALRPVLRVDDRMLDLGRDADLALRPSNEPPPDAIGRRVGAIGWAVYGPESAGDGALPWVVYGGGGPAAPTRWRRDNRRDVPTLAEVSSVGAMRDVLRSTEAVGLLPCYVGDAEARLTRRGEPIAAAQTALWLLVHADLRRSSRVRALIDHLVPRLESARATLAGR